MDDIIDRERLWLEPLKKVNDIYIDTSGFSVNQLKKQLDGLFSKDSKTKLSIRIISLVINMDYQEKQILFLI